MGSCLENRRPTYRRALGHRITVPLHKFGEPTTKRRTNPAPPTLSRPLASGPDFSPYQIFNFSGSGGVPNDARSKRVQYRCLSDQLGHNSQAGMAEQHILLELRQLHH